jgi:Protein of unknown function VcgC/VcgE (DUF2780)
MTDLLDALAGEIAARTPLDAIQARTALAGALSLIEKHAHGEKVEALFNAVPGARALAAEAPTASGGGGLFGGLMSAVGGGALAEGMAMMQSLSKSGISSADLQKALPVAMEFLKGHAGADVLGDALASIPGAGGLLSRG